MKKLPFTVFYSLFVGFLFLVGCRESAPPPLKAPGYIQISENNPDYFALADGSPYIPVGINMINPSGKNHGNPDSALLEIESWMKNLSANGGNYIRIWLSQSFWDIEEEAGIYNEEKARRIDRYFELARKYGLRIKVTFEHFRSLTIEENPQQWATKFAYHTSNGGPLDSIRQYLISDAGKKLFTDKIDYYRDRYGSDSLFFGFELWNEMNAMKGPEDSVFFAWNEEMLAQVKSRFPEHLVMQSLGSFDNDRVRPLYRKMMELPGNEVAQIHRYLDLGASMEICHAPMDIIASSAIEEVKSYHMGKPVLLAETGAVEPRHSGPSKYYQNDTAGILLHDLLFAPFFAGSAGAGMSWHWESYVHRNHLWYHFGRFSEAISKINPIDEGLKPGKFEDDSFRVYNLEGKNTTLFWLRDKTNTWQTELEKGTAPGLIKAYNFTLPPHLGSETFSEILIYDPWKNQWTKGEVNSGKILLPDFRRSLVIRCNV